MYQNKVVKSKPRRKRRTKAEMAKQGSSDRTNERQGEEIMELKKMAKGKPRRKRRTKAQIAEAKAMGMEDKRSGGGGKKSVAKKKLQMTYNQFKKTPNGKKWVEKRESALGSYYAPNLKDYWDNTRKQKGATSLEYIKNGVDKILKANRAIGMFGGGGKKASFKLGTYEEEEKRNNYKNPIRDYFDAENEAYRDNEYLTRRAYYDNEKRGEERQAKLMDQAVNHAFRFTRKIFNIVKKRKFKTRKEFEEAFSKEMGYTL